MTVSLWHDPPRPTRPALGADARADVLVLGGGMTGIFSAYHAARAGARIVLLERERLCAGASGRNAGFLMSAPEALYAESVQAHGRDLARDVWRVNRRNLHAARALLAKLGAGAHMQDTGSVLGAVSEGEWREMQESARMLREDGLPAELFDAKQTEAATNGVGFLGGLRTPDDGQVHPVSALHVVADAAEREGARIHEGTPVVSLAREGAEWVARTDHGHSIRARSVITGLNAYSPDLLAHARGRVRPVRGQVLAVDAGRPIVPCPVYADRGYLYVRGHGDRIVAGGMRHTSFAAEETSADATNASVQGEIERALHAHWPSARGAQVTHRWSGIMGFSVDGLPWVGEVPGAPGLFSAFACTGHGWGYWPWAGEALARAAMGDALAVPTWARMDRAPLSAL